VRTREETGGGRYRRDFRLNKRTDRQGMDGCDTTERRPVGGIGMQGNAMQMLLPSIMFDRASACEEMPIGDNYPTFGKENKNNQ
jgi:hypothetical protein